MQRKRRTFSNTELVRAIKADRRRRRAALQSTDRKGCDSPDGSARKRPIFIPTAGPSLRELIRRRLEDYGARGRTVARFARSPWIGGEPRQKIDNARR